jgi:hypothetical protein
LRIETGGIAIDLQQIGGMGSNSASREGKGDKEFQGRLHA